MLSCSVVVDWSPHVYLKCFMTKLIEVFRRSDHCQVSSLNWLFTYQLIAFTRRKVAYGSHLVHLIFRSPQIRHEIVLSFALVPKDDEGVRQV